MRTSSVRVARVKVAMAIGVAAFIGMGSLAAAAADGSTTDVPTTEPTLEPAPTGPVAKAKPAVSPAGQDAEEPSPDAVDEPQVDAEPPEDDDIAVSPTDPSGACVTHGQRVSEIARTTPPGPGHGAAVSAAAHDHEGECAHDDDHEPAEEPPSESGATAPPSSVAPAPAGPVVAPGGPDRPISQQGHGQGTGGAHAKG